MKKIFFLSVFIGLTTIACPNNTNKKNLNNRLIGSWTTIQQLIPEFNRSLDDLETNKITVDEFKKESSALLQAYTFFFASLQKTHDFNPKFAKLVQLVSSYNQSQSKSDMRRVYQEIDKFNTDWSNTFYEEQTLY